LCALSQVVVISVRKILSAVMVIYVSFNIIQYALILKVVLQSVESGGLELYHPFLFIPFSAITDAGYERIDMRLARLLKIDLAVSYIFRWTWLDRVCNVVMYLLFLRDLMVLTSNLVSSTWFHQRKYIQSSPEFEMAFPQRLSPIIAFT
jgi:hypothetical protein